MILILITLEQDMDQVIHGVNKPFNIFSLSNYSLTSQIVIINLSTALLALIFIIIFNFFLLSSNKNLEIQKNKITYQLKEITDYLSKNAIKRILTFDDNCNRILREDDINCDYQNTNDVIDKNYEDKLPQLDPTYTQQYIYSKYSSSNLTVKVFSDNWLKLADTNDFYSGKEDVVIMDIDSKIINEKIKNYNFYQQYKKIYFNLYSLLQKYLDEQKLKKLKNDNITVMETIKTKQSTSYMFKDEDKKFKSIFASPILKDNKVYGVVLMMAPFTYNNYESANQSILLTNFFIFFISVMFFLSLLFSKSIVAPIKVLSYITKLERNKFYNKDKKIQYPNRNDEIGTLSFDIKKMSEDLKKRINEIEEFAADVSHELKNPLSGLKSSSELLKKNLLDSQNRALLIKNMTEDIDRMNILISDISNYTLTQVEISEEIFEKIELNNFLYEFKNSVSYKNLEIVIKSENKNIILQINKNKFVQVLHNLLDNALSYMLSDSKILFFIKIENRNCILHFVDQGPGISLDYKDKIFERFYTDRLDERKLHSGLGLSISKNIILSFGGKINLIKSMHSGFEGACFEIILPLKD